jgi:hypothetical protein
MRGYFLRRCRLFNRAFEALIIPGYVQLRSMSAHLHEIRTSIGNTKFQARVYLSGIRQHQSNCHFGHTYLNLNNQTRYTPCRILA